MKYASVCSGVEAASLAWGVLGWEPVWFSEIESFPCAVLATRFPNVQNLGDMTKIEGEKYHGTVDILVGGTPCQDVSVAGKRKGFAGERSGLAFSYIRLLKTMRPRWFVWENVPGVLSSNNGEDFKAFIRSIDEIGYSCAWRVLDAQYVRVDGYPGAVPQRRRRVFAVGHLGADWRYPASVLFEPDCVPRDTPPRRKAGEGVARSVTASTGGASGKEQQIDFVGGNGRPLNAIESGHGFYSESDVAQTTEAQEDQHRRNILCMATGQGGAETGENCAVNLTCNHEAPIIGAFMPEQGAKAGSIAWSEEHYPALMAGDSGTNRVPAVLCVHGSQDPITNTDHAKAGTGGGNLPLVHECFPINSMIIGKEVKDGDRQTTGIGNAEDPCPTIGTSHHHAVAQNATTVRRLTPVECERLMGFPDNWTRIPWKLYQECGRKGWSFESELEKRGKKLKTTVDDCPDSPRYKACGNSMCVNVMRWIGMRIEIVERKEVSC